MAFTRPHQTKKPLPKPAPKPKPSTPIPLDPTKQSAFDLMAAALKDWGLTSLTADLRKLIVNGDSQPDTLTLALRSTKAYQARFAANAVREKNGLPALSPAAYLALEEQYHQVLAALPKGFYDTKASTDKWIGGDVSPAELAQRVQDANDAYVAAPATARAAWDKYYGTAGQAGAVAAILDPATAEPLIQQQVTAAGIGGAALQSGLSLTNKAKATLAAQEGVTLAGARQTYQQIAARVGADHSIASRFGTTFDQGQEEDANLLGDATATLKQNRIYAEETAEFGGHGGNTDASNSGGANV